MKNPHKHHIIPVYHCKELGIDPDFDENIVEVDRLDHARIHWGYKCDDLEPLFEYITPAQWIIDLIPRGDKRDVGAAVITARGEIDGIDMSGENNPSYKHGKTVGKYTLPKEQWRKQYNEYQNEWREETGYKKKWDKDNWEREAERKRKSWKTWPSRIKKIEDRIRNKAEKQGESTLEAFLK